MFSRSRVAVVVLIGLLAVLGSRYRFSAPVPAVPPQPASGEAVAPRMGALKNPPPAPLAKTVMTAAWSSTERPFRWPASIPEPRFARFVEWSERYLHADPANRPTLEAEGVALARQRREKLEDLIPADPKRALELAVPYAVRKALPAAILAEVETSISARGDLNVFGVLPEPGREGQIPPVYRTAEFGETIYQAHVYGRRLDEPTRHNIPLSGIAVNNLAALSSDPVRLLGPEEAADAKAALAAADPVCSISGNLASGGGDETVAEVGGDIHYFCATGHASLLNDQLIAAESGPSDGAVAAGDLAESAYTEGTKRMLVIRVDFSDLAGAPFSDTAATNMIKGLNDFYREMSYGKAGFSLAGDGSEFTPVFRMPQTAAYYGTNDASRLRTAARNAARTGGYVLGNYDFDLICFGAVPGFQWSGLGYVGSPGSWIRATSGVGVSAHELGHNFGLNHANFWDTSNAGIIGRGSSVEYGDKFDTMGSANAGNKHFNARYKSYLNWLTASEVLTVTSNGTYRLFPHDDPAARGVRALRIARSSNTNYWVELRQRYTGNKWLADGIGIRWAFGANQSSLLLDTTPGTVNGKDDSAVLIGRTFADAGAGVYITPIAKAGTTPESFDIVVNKGLFPANVPPVILVTAAATNAAANGLLTFSAQATDTNGDALAYFWDFGDESWGTNGPAASHRWTTAGEYVVRCIVTDMKGGEASDSVVVRIGNPSTFRLAGRVITPAGVPVQGARVFVSATRMTWTDSDGRYALVGLGAGSYNVQTVLENYTFTASVTGSIQVGPSREKVDFLALPPNGLQTSSLVAAGAEWLYRDTGTNLGTVWREIVFDDSTWNKGAAPLGYGDEERTPLSFGPSSSSKYITTYFRRAFTVADPSKLSNLTLSLRRDDGGIVYLNGREVFRSNMPSGAVTYTTLASASVGGNDELAFFDTSLDPSLLRKGTNVLAVEIHQNSRSSSDLVFDLQLTGATAATILPPNVAVQFGGDSIKVAWPDTPNQWQLYALPGLDATNIWVPVTILPDLLHDLRVITIPVAEGQQFFRLGSP